MALCIFCPNQRTKKGGEHVWDDWLNREGGKEIKAKSTTFYYGSDGAFIRSYPSTRLDVTAPVVCDPCNNTWMSDLSGLAKDRLEAIIRQGTPRDFDDLDLLTITALAFLKSAVLDWAATDKGRKPCISRSMCLAFRDSLTSDRLNNVALPDGLQVWIAKYIRTRKMEALAFTEEMKGVSDFKGYRIVVTTYVVGSVIFQTTCPRWAKNTRQRPPAPFFEMLGDLWSVPIWPGVGRAYWPPVGDIDGSSLEAFRERFTRVHIRRNR